ncbi:MAG: GAF domain-containing protein [Acidobacteria bacterium]|nr:GAF domain-containing protein [Acidobacteriota bacterium]
MRTRIARYPRHYLALGLVCFCAFAYLTGFTIQQMRLLANATNIAREPASFGIRLNRISGTSPELAAAGARFGDRLLEVEGRPFTGTMVLTEEVEKRRPGDSLRLTIQKPDSAPQPVTVRLAPVRSEPATLVSWTLTLIQKILFPYFCLALGAFVVWMRPTDTNAWILLGVMITFPLMTSDATWSGPGYPFAATWRTIGGMMAPVFLLMFGIFFPERLAFERRHGWMKWLLAGPIIILSAVASFQALARAYRMELGAGLAPYAGRIYLCQMMIGMACIGTYFFLLGLKSGKASSADARRRLRILWMGSGASLLPLFIAVLTALISDRDLFHGYPYWVILASLLALILFPLTYAYVIVVNRAMDVGVAIRQGAKYAMARGGLSILRALVLGLALLAVWNLARANPIRNADLVQAAGTVGVLLALRERFSGRISRWLDRRFFRDAYQAEQVLSDLAGQVREFVDIQPLITTVTERVSRILHVPRVAVLLRNEDAFSVAGGTVAVPGMPLAPSAVSIRRVAEKNQPATAYFDDPECWIHTAPPDEKSTLGALDARLLLPVAGREQMLGMMVLGPKLSEEPFTPTDVQLLQSVAAQTGLAIENNQLVARIAREAAQRERLNREIEIAREVQERLYPQNCPVVRGVEYAGHCRPAHSVGGDYYDFLPSSSNRFGIAIGDISGKGISAALLMACLQASLRGQAMAGTGNLATMLGNVNKLVYASSSANRYATFFYAEYDPESGALTYVNAGHNAPMLVRGGEVIRLDVGGPVIGLLPIAPYRQAVFQTQPGDVLVGFTDGISEAMNLQEEDWGEDRLLSCIHGCLAESPRGIIDRIMEGADAFAAGAPQHDDMTLIAIKFGVRA